MGEYTRPVSMQRLGKLVPVARQQILNNATVDSNATMEELCLLRGPCRDDISMGQSRQF
jgi:hypothetical protein